jgi:hypothetical protein
MRKRCRRSNQVSPLSANPPMTINIEGDVVYRSASRMINRSSCRETAQRDTQCVDTRHQRRLRLGETHHGEAESMTHLKQKRMNNPTKTGKVLLTKHSAPTAGSSKASILVFRGRTISQLARCLALAASINLNIGINVAGHKNPPENAHEGDWSISVQR